MYIHIVKRIYLYIDINSTTYTQSFNDKRRHMERARNQISWWKGTSTQRERKDTQNGLPYLEPLGWKPGSIATGSQAAMLQVSRPGLPEQAR